MLKCKTFILTPSKLTRTCRRVLLSHATQIYSSTQTVHLGCDSSIWAFSFYCHSSHELTRPSRRFLSSAVAYTDQTVHENVFLPLTQPTKANLSTHADVYFPLSQSTQANLSTKTLSFH